MIGLTEDAATLTISPCLTASSKLVVALALIEYFLAISSAKACALSKNKSQTTSSFAFFASVIIPSKQALPIGPAPTQVITFASFLAKYLVPTPGTQPVRTELITLPDINAIGSQVSGSLSITIKIERGKPRLGLIMFEPYHFSPATLNLPPTYAGIAIKRLSGPSIGIFGKGLSFGKPILIPCELALSPPIR